MNASKWLVVDIETIPDPELPFVSDDPKKFPAAPHHQVVVIGLMLLDSDCVVKRMTTLKGSEAEVLKSFVTIVEKYQPTLVTFNGRSFDLPVVAIRCLRHAITFSYYYNSRNVRYRYSAEGHLDIMDYIADFGASKFANLNVIAKLCGMPGKTDVDGSQVGQLVAEGHLTRVQEYCMCDVIQTAAVFLRLQLVRGELSKDSYNNAMTELLDVARWFPALATLKKERLILS